MLINNIYSGLSTTSPLSEISNKNQGNESAFILEQTRDDIPLSPLAQVSMSFGISDLNISENETSFSYYKSDNSLAMRASSQTDIHLHQETYQFDITYSAEALGLSKTDFAQNKPMKLSFSFTDQSFDYKSIATAQVVQRTRDPLEVLTDLAQAIRDVMSDPGNKSVSFELDDEARKAILSDPKITKLYNDLVMVMAYINLAKQAGERNHYNISVSGKAKPWIDYQEKTELNQYSRTVNFTITINPPAEEKDASSIADVATGDTSAVQLETQS